MFINFKKGEIAMKRGTKFLNSEAVEKILKHGSGVVVVPASTGAGVEVYDDSKKINTHQKELDLNLAGAEVFYGDRAYLVVKQ